MSGNVEKFFTNLDVLSNLNFCFLKLAKLYKCFFNIVKHAYTVKKVSDFPVPSRNVTNQPLLAGNNLVIPALTFFYSVVVVNTGAYEAHTGQHQL
jgi:hypothetical protein